MRGSKRQGSVGDMVAYWTWEGVNDKEVWEIWWVTGCGRE